MRHAAIFCCLVVLALGTSCARGARQARQPAAPADHRAQDAAAIESIDAEWVKAAQAKDNQKILSFYADNAVAIWPGSPMANGKAAIGKLWADSMATPGFALTFAPIKTVVSRSGDLAYEIGNYQQTANDKRGKPQTTSAKFVLIWGKQADGTWKVVVDTSTTTP